MAVYLRWRFGQNVPSGTELIHGGRQIQFDVHDPSNYVPAVAKEILSLVRQLQAARIERGLSLAELARRTGCSRALLSAVEGGKACPSVSTLERLAQALGLTVTLTDPAGPGFSERLATVDLVELGPEALSREIELEAVRLFGLESASLVFGSESSPEGREPRLTPTGVLIPLASGLLLGEGKPPTGWAARAARFSAQASSIVRAHDLILAKRQHEAVLAALYETAGQLTAHLDVETVLNTIVEKARGLLAADLAYITLLDLDADVVRMQVSWGHVTPTFLDIVLPIGSGVGGIVVETAKPAYSPDYLNDERLSHDARTDEGVRQERIRSILGVPLRGRSGVLGVLYVANRSVHSFSGEEVNLLGSLGNHAALALENARLYEQAVTAARISAEAEAIGAARLNDLERVERVHRVLTDVVLAGEGVDGVARSLANALGVGVLVTDWRQMVLAHEGAGEYLDGRGSLASAFVRNPDVRNALLTCGNSFSSTAAGDRTILAPIVARQEILGYIWAFRLDPERTNFVVTSLEQAARVVAMEMLRERASLEAEQRLRSDFASSLLLSDPAANRTLLERMAQQVWVDRASPHRPVIFRLGEAETGGGLARARALIAEARPADFTAIHGDYVIVMLRETDDQRALDIVKEIRSVLAQQGLHAAAVIGGVCDSLDADRSTIQAAIRLQHLLGTRPIVLLEGLEVLTMLFDAVSRERLREFLDRALAPLAQNPELIATLAAYYESSGNRSLAARRLGVHVNTLRYRLERVESLVGGPVDDPSRSVPLQIAILARNATL